MVGTTAGRRLRDQWTRPPQAPPQAKASNESSRTCWKPSGVAKRLDWNAFLRVLSKNRGTPKWMLYDGKPYWNGWFGGTLFRKHPWRFKLCCWFQPLFEKYQSVRIISQNRDEHLKKTFELPPPSSRLVLLLEVDLVTSKYTRLYPDNIT